MQRSRRFGNRNSSPGCWRPSIAARVKVNEITPFSCWHVDWECVVGDIRTLKLEQLHWEDSIIEVTQSKTGAPLKLPLTNEVGEALIDYLKSGRRQSAHREVFLKAK